VIAANGREGIEIVRKRMADGLKPFDLIFMDIQMPVMDGLEAAPKIAALGTGSPIVAMTANVMVDDKELYRANNMPDCIGKPFSAQELWHCLLKYIRSAEQKPARQETMDDLDMNLRETLKGHFAKHNQGKFAEIKGALDSGDIKLAHRLAHTLKSNAGQIGKTLLQKAAADVERLLKDGENKAAGEPLTVLETELNRVLDELSPFLNETVKETRPAAFNTEKVKELAEKLEPLLKSGNPECLKYIEELRILIPGSEELIQQMENYDFELAKTTFARLMALI
jgi:CheY-like chemotaxis protein